MTSHKFLIGYWLVGNMSLYQENLFQSRIFLHLFPSFIELSKKYFIKAIEDFFSVFPYSSKHEGTWENSRQLCIPSAASRVCITVSNSPNALRLRLGFE